MGRYNSTRFDERRKCRILLAIKSRACTAGGMGEGSPLYDPGSELYYCEGESSAGVTINGMGKRKEVKCITAAVTTRYPSKLHRSIRSGPTAVYCAIGPCTTSLITGQYEMMVTSLNLLNFLASGGFLYPRTPAEPINRRFGYTVWGGIEAGRRLKCSRTAGLGYPNKNSAVARVAPFFSN